MTNKEKKDFRTMYRALQRIKSYQSADQLRRNSEKQYGLDFDEALEMAYENILGEAKNGIKGVRLPKEEGATNGN